MRATLSLVISAIFAGLNFHLVKFMLSESSYPEAAIWRYIFAIFTLLIISLGAIRTWKNIKVSIKGIVLVGLVGLFCFNITFYIGIQQTSALNGSLILSLNPITTILLSALILKTEVKWYHFVGAAISLLGVILLLTEGNILNLKSHNFNKGDLLIFIANIIFALYHIWVRKYKKDTPNVQFTIFTNALCAIGFIVLSFFIPTPDFHIEHTTNYWLWTFGAGVLGTGIAFLLWNYGVSEVGADQAGIFMNVVPLATAISALFFGLQIHSYHIYSGVIIIAGIVFMQLIGPKIKKDVKA